MATHFGTLAWRITSTKEPGGYSQWGTKESDTNEATQHAHTHIFKIDNQQGPNIQHREFCSNFFNDLNRKRI